MLYEVITYLQDVLLELRHLVEKQHAAMGEGCLAGLGIAAAERKRQQKPTKLSYKDVITSYSIHYTKLYEYTDYNFPVDELRKELTRLLESCTLWDKKVNVIQVTDSKENYMEVRILVSAKNSPTAWDP